MQKATESEYGVSPAFFVSLYGEGFGPSEVEASLPLVAQLGYTAYQGEVFLRSVLSEWTPGRTRAVRQRAADCGLRSDVFVAHFAGHGLAWVGSEADRDSGLVDFRRACEIAAELTSGPGSMATIVVPSLPVESTAGSFAELWPAAVATVETFTGIAAKAGLRLAVEPVPGGLVSSGSWFSRLADELDREIWFVLDTGNIWAAGEVVPHAAERLCSRLAATHLCDAGGLKARSAEPGTGEVDLRGTLRALTSGACTCGLDVEISSPAKEVALTYGRAIDYMRREAPVL